MNEQPIKNLAQRIQSHTPHEQSRGLFRREKWLECDCGWIGTTHQEASIHTAEAIINGCSTPIQWKPSQEQP